MYFQKINFKKNNLFRLSLFLKLKFQVRKVESKQEVFTCSKCLGDLGDGMFFRIQQSRNYKRMGDRIEKKSTLLSELLLSRLFGNCY